jgi:hypothetical protein
MRTNPPDRKRGRDGTGTGRASARPGRARASQGGERVSVVVVLAFTFASTAISIYDLYLLVTRLAP